MSNLEARKRMKRLRWLLIGLLLLFVFVAWNWRVTDTPSKTLPSPPSSNTSQAPIVPPTTPADNGPGTRAAVLAGQTSLSLFPSLQFSPRGFVVQQVRKLAVPEVKDELATTLVESGRIIATQFMGYLSVDQAANQANYSELPLMYRVERIDGDEAEISYFVESQWLDASGNEFHYPGITVVTLKQISGKWLFVSAVTNPPDLRPELEEGLTYDETVARYRPLLKGFRDVSDIT